MSYKTWHEYGYGIIVDDIKHTSVDKILKLVHMAPKFEKDFLQWIDESYGETITVDDIMEYEDDSCYRGLGPIIRNVINEVDGIDFYVCEDFDCRQYLMYLPTYPWYMKENEYKFSEEDIANIFRKYVSIVTDDVVEIDYQECENGG